MQIFVKQIIYQQVLNYQKLSYLRWYNQGGFLGRLLGALLKSGLPLIKNVIKPLAKGVLIPLGLPAAGSPADAGIHKKILGSGNPPSSHNRPWSSASHNTVLIISNDETEDIIKIVKSLEDFDLLLKGVTEKVKNKVKEQKGRFLSMWLGTLDASLLGMIVTGRGINRAGEGIVRAGYGNKKSRKKNKIKWIFNAASSVK